MAISMKTVLLAADHGGVILKNTLKSYLRQQGYTVSDLGTDSSASVDYPDFAKRLVNGLTADAYGILICGTGIGMSIRANRDPKVRAALCTSVEMARLAREHNDANVLCLGGRIIEPSLAATIVDTFLQTAFTGEERHVRRITKLS